MAVSTSIYGTTLTTLALTKSYLGGDGLLNTEPVHDVLRDADADHHNKRAAGLSEVAMRTRKGVIVPYHFSIADATSGITTQQLVCLTAGDADWTEYAAPFDGSVVGLVAHSEGARTAGTATLVWSLAGTAQTLSAVIDDTDTQVARGVQLPGVETFDAKDLLGIELTTDGSWAAGVTPSIWATLYVSYGEEEAI